MGQNETSELGDLVHDSHAEVIAKRAFVIYLIDQVKKTFEGQKSILDKNESGYLTLSKHLELYFYSSFPPCGDATIASKNNDRIDDKNDYKNDNDNDDDDNEPNFKKPKIEIYRTGAKSPSDPLENDANYHIIGQWFPNCLGILFQLLIF